MHGRSLDTVLDYLVRRCIARSMYQLPSRSALETQKDKSTRVANLLSAATSSKHLRTISGAESCLRQAVNFNAFTARAHSCIVVSTPASGAIQRRNQAYIEDLLVVTYVKVAEAELIVFCSLVTCSVAS